MGLVRQGITGTKQGLTETLRYRSWTSSTVRIPESEDVRYRRGAFETGGGFIMNRLRTLMRKMLNVITLHYAVPDYSLDEGRRKILESEDALREVLETQKKIEARQRILDIQVDHRGYHGK